MAAPDRPDERTPAVNIRDELVDIVWEATGRGIDASSDQGADWQRCEFTADALLARFPWLAEEHTEQRQTMLGGNTFVWWQTKPRQET